MSQLTDVVIGLPDDAQKRVLAYALGELRELLIEEAGAPDDLVKSYSTLRSNLRPLARKVFDLIATSGKEQLLIVDIAQALGLATGRELGQLERSVASTVKKISKSGIHIKESPLTVHLDSRGAKCFALSSETIKAWSLLAEADSEATSKATPSQAS